MSASTKENLRIDAELIIRLLGEGNKDMVEEMLLSRHPADIARLMDDLGHDERKTVFNLLSPQAASEIILELSDEARERILEDMESRRVGEIIDHMDSDDAADLLGELPEEEVDRVLEFIPEEETRKVKSLLAYEDDTAGGIMQTEVASIHSDATVQETISRLRKNRDEIRDMHNVFVTDHYRKLLGILPVRRLVLELPDTLISQIMDTDIVSARLDDDQEEVARLFKKYDLLSIPVLDTSDRLVGRITVDDIMDVVEEEASEDFFRMAGAGHEDTIPSSILKSAKMRLPWLFASCMGGIVALKIIGAFENSLGRLVVLASFIPVILGMGGNIGTQSTTIVVRGLAIGSIDASELWSLVFKEVKVGLILGIIYGTFLTLITLFVYPDNAMLSIVVGLSMCTAMILAAAMGTLMPIVLYKFGVDPAIATGPFVTTSVDILGILILFNFASFFLF